MVKKDIQSIKKLFQHEFVEGKRAYIIKEPESINEVNEYRILFVHQHTYALVEDVEHKKWIIHMNCLEQLTA